MVFVLLGHAADDADDEIGPRLLGVLETAERGVDLFLGVLADAAGVEKNGVGGVGVGRQLITVLAQSPHDELGVEHVHLAADGFDEQLSLFHVFRSCETKQLGKSVDFIGSRAANEGGH